MRFLILSDLRLEFAAVEPNAPTAEFDAVILAGDILPGAEELLTWVRRTAQWACDKPVIVVPGNHEFYGGVLQEQRRLMRQKVHVLDLGEVLLDDGRLRVIGCTLWTDFKLPIATADGPVSDQQRAMENAARYMSGRGGHAPCAFAGIRRTEMGRRLADTVVRERPSVPVLRNACALDSWAHPRQLGLSAWPHTGGQQSPGLSHEGWHLRK